MAKQRSKGEEGGVATMEPPVANVTPGPIDPHTSDTVPEVSPVVVGNEPLAAETGDSMFAAERTVTEGAKTSKIEFSRLYRSNNVRTSGEKSSENLAAMLVSMRRHGYRPESPITVSLKAKPTDSKGRDALVVKGNRRAIALEWFYDNERDTFDKLVPNGFVPAIVYTDLSEKDEALLRIDHGKDEDRAPLTEYEEFLSVKQLVQVGFGSETAIAEKMDKYTGKMENRKPARSWAQTRVALARMPQFVQDEMQKSLEGTTRGGANDGFASPLTWSHILQAQFTIPTTVAIVKDQKVSGLNGAKNADMTNAAKGWVNGEGPIFRHVWDQIVNPAKTEQAPKAVAVSPKVMGDLAQARSSRNLRSALSVLCLPGTPGLKDIDGDMVRAEEAERILGEIADFLGEAAFAKLKAEAIAHAAAKAPQPAPTEEPAPPVQS